MKRANLDSPDLYINRELSWLEFNDRVLKEGCAADVPLMERLKFLSIVSSNLDEFFMIRVAGLKQRQAARVNLRDASGLAPSDQLRLISQRVHRMVAEQTAAIREVTTQLAKHGLHFVDVRDVDIKQRKFLESYSLSELLPILTPLAVESLDPFPVLPGLALNLAFLLGLPGDDQHSSRVAIVPLPGNVPRFITVPSQHGLQLVRLEQVVAMNIDQLFPDYNVLGSALFSITRDADVSVDEDETDDLLHAVEEAMKSRRRRAVVRLTVFAEADPRLKQWLEKWFEVAEEDLYEVDGLLNAAALTEVVNRPGFDHLRYPLWPPQLPRDLVGCENIWETLQDKDVLLFHPYESFEPVVSLVQQAADDPDVLAIKQTLYRTSGESPIVAALARAAESGKQVTVLVELKARFDETTNVNWARRLEDAGCHVIYGVAGLKTHGKLLLIVRRERNGIRRYVHCSTGNYNDRTATLYSDIGLITTNLEIAADASAFFNLLTGYSQEVGWSQLAISPRGLRQRIMELIHREAEASTIDQPGLIMIKVNSLEDKEVCQALYRASQAGVRVLLNVRGICGLRPGIEGVSENIEVISVVDRYLEHARIFYFHNGGHEEVYLSSADLMRRNLDRRLEILFPVLEWNLRMRMATMLETFFADNTKAWRLSSEGTYERLKHPGQPVRAQEVFYRQAVETTLSDEAKYIQLKPLMKPQTR